MGTRYVECDVACPFYRDTIEKDIICEGAFGSTRNIMRFTTKEEAKEWLNKSCSDRYDLCHIYRMIMREKYAKEKL